MGRVFVTGGSRGMGLAIVEMFINNGFEVIATYNRSEESVEKIEKRLNSKRLRFIRLNLMDDGSIDHCLSQLPGPIDILINNAGVGSATVDDQAENKRAQDKVFMQVNALGPLWLAESIIQFNQKQALKIINISSVGGGIFHYPGFRHADGMSKAALTFFTKQLAAEHVHTNIDVYAICPGASNTNMFNASTLDHLSEEERNKYFKKLPKQRLIETDEIANICLWLSGKEAKVLHGAVIDASMGLGVAPSCLC